MGENLPQFVAGFARIQCVQNSGESSTVVFRLPLALSVFAIRPSIVESPNKRGMHELSIATSLLKLACDTASQAGAAHIVSLQVRMGALSCVHEDSLRFSFELLAKGTVAEDATLRIVNLPVVIYCSLCNLESPLIGIQSLRCPRCDSPCSEVRQGNELELESIEIKDPTPTIEKQEIDATTNP